MKILMALSTTGVGYLQFVTVVSLIIIFLYSKRMKTTTKTRERETMKSEKVRIQAGDLYTAGLSIDDVARTLNINYRTARKAINLSGATLRDSSERLKGRTRPDKKKEKV